MLASKPAAAPGASATASRQPRTHRRALTLAAKASLSPRGGATSGTATSDSPHAPHAPQHLLQPQQPACSSTACHAAPAAAPAAAESSLGLQGAPLAAGPLLVPARRKNLVQAIKSHRKQLEQQRRPCPPANFVQDDARGAEAAVVGQLLLELRRIELHQVAPHGDGCTTLPLPRPTAAAALQQQPAAVRLRAVIDGAGEEDPWEAGLDLSSELFVPRAYPVPGRVLVCQGGKCQAKGALGVLQAVSAVAAGADSAVQVLPCKCLGKCKEGAVVRVKQDGVAKCAVYTQLEPAHVPGILDSHFLAPAAAPAPPEPEPAVAGGGATDACCTDCRTTAPVMA